MAKKSAKPKWSDVKRQIQDWEPRKLVGLVKDMFDASLENRRFLAARFLQDDLGPEVLEPYRERIHEAFYARNGWPQEHLELAEARRAIREYRKATGDVEGTVELLLTYVETGTDFTLNFGDIDEPLYASLSSTLEEIEKLFRGKGRDLYTPLRDRFRELARRAGGIGWGFGDHVTDVVAVLEEKAARSG